MYDSREAQFLQQASLADLCILSGVAKSVRDEYKRRGDIYPMQRILLYLARAVVYSSYIPAELTPLSVLIKRMPKTVEFKTVIARLITMANEGQRMDGDDLWKLEAEGMS